MELFNKLLIYLGRVNRTPGGAIAPSWILPELNTGYRLDSAGAKFCGARGKSY